MNINRITKVIMVFFVLIFLVGTFTACSAKKEDGNLTVRIAYFPNITHSQALIGKAEGQFQKALGDNIKIEWKQFNAGSSEIEALLAGEIDIGYIGPGPAINGYVKSKGELQIISGATNAGAILVSRKDTAIKDIKDLSGKRIAVPQFGNTQDLILRYLLQQYGLKCTTKGGTVEIRQAANSDIKILLDKGDIDAALVPEPWGSRLVKEVNANIVLDYDQVWRDGKYAAAVVIVRTKFLKEYPDIVEKFLRTHVELTEYVNENVDKAKETVNAQINELTKKSLSKDVLDESFKRLVITTNPEIDSIKEFITLSMNIRNLKQAPDAENFLNLEILNRVLKEKGVQEVK
ncbi:MAG: sulfonate transport system substrate-binding protein [Petroclostridium sp.]|jgi:NitT/TauT family transport system substrate-binding protein|nr:sulfonate transport system substrate-binding protein [Petroclostridium sp.]